MNTIKSILFSAAIGFSAYANAQTFDTTAWKYANTITSQELSQHLHIIASDEMEGRETGKNGQKLAMKYLIEQFKSYGIKDYKGLNYKQTYPLVEQESKGVNLEFDGVSFELNEDFAITPNIISNKVIEGELIFMGKGDEASYEQTDIKGKAVFFWADKTDGRGALKKKIDLATSKGATAVFYYDRTLKGVLSKFKHYFEKPKTKLVDDLSNDNPSIRLTEEAANAILKAGKLKVQKLEKKGLKKNKIFSTNFKLSIDKPTNQLSGENVLAFIEGTDAKDEVIIVTAHYDHIGMNDSLIFNGADDDGTGTATLLELAQAFSQAARNGHRPKRSILIMPVSGEEKGLLGSKFYTNHPIFPLESTVANLNVDMIGRYDESHEVGSNYIYLIGSDKLSTELHRLSEKVNGTYTKIGLDYTFNDENDPNRFYYRSDHYNFAKNNIPVIFYFSGVHEDYHKATDTVEKIDFAKTEKVARLVFLTAWELANREERIKVDKVEAE